MDTIKQTILILLMGMSALLTASAQKVTFFSAGFEQGVKVHLGLDQNSDVTQQHTDTITTINLSGLGISDIRDVMYLAQVKSLDLSFNNIKDIAPLLPLESLHDVDLSGNLLEDINVLPFASSDSIVVNVAYNYITDFSHVLFPSNCRIGIAGMSAQKDKNAQYLDVCHFYTYINEDEKPVVTFRGYTNQSGACSVKTGSANFSAQLDGNSHMVDLPETLTNTTKVTLTNGDQSEVTYLVPPAYYTVGAGKTITMETGLPDNYKLTSASTSSGTVEIVGSSLKYTAPATAVADVVSFSYYKGSTLKGFSRFYLNRGSKPGDVNGDGKVTVADAVAILSYILDEPPTTFSSEAADVNGDKAVTIADAIQVIDMILHAE